MEKYKSREITDKDIWEGYVLSQKPQSFLQSWNWGETHVLYGEKIWRLGFYEGGKVVGVALLIGQKAKRGVHILIPGGPLIDWSNKELVSFTLTSLKKIAREYGAWFVRMRPELLDTPQNRKLLQNFGFVGAPMHLHAENTWVLDISKTEDVLMSQMRKNTRYLVRKSLVSGLTIKTGLLNIKTLSELQTETVSRKKFVGFSEKFFESQIKTFGKDDQIQLYVVEKDKLKLAAALIIYYGDYAYYHHSGSSNMFREIPSSYFLQWRVINDAKKRGLKGYNFWGIAPEGMKNHRFSGVTTFKTGFGGERIDWIHAQDLRISPLYFATFIYETFRKKIRKL